MKTKIHNTKFRTKIILLFLILLLLYSVISGTLFYKYTFKDTLNNYTQSTEDIVYQLSTHLYKRFSSITKSVHALNNNMSFVNPMRVFLKNPNTLNYANLMGEVADSITEMQMSDEYIHSIYIYTEYGDFDNFVQIKRHDVEFRQTEVYQYFKENPQETSAWFSARNNPVFIGNEIVIPVVYKFRFARENVFIMVNLDQLKIKEYLRETYKSYDNIFIVDKNGENVVNYNDSYKDVLSFAKTEGNLNERAVCKRIEVNDVDYLATCTIMKGNGWNIYALKSTDSLVGNLTQLRNFILIVMSVSAVLALVVVILCVRTLTAPLGNLVEIMDKTINNEFHIKFDYPYEDEVGNLAKSFNYMVYEIETLIQELNLNIEALKEEKEIVKKIQEQKRKAEIRALQAQINPHFLYNSLNTITWQAADQGAKEISILSNALGKFFRIALSNGREIINVKEEIEHVKSYLDIQKIRYKSKINYSISIPEEIQRFSMIKLLLQPLVENSIYHGIKTKGTGGNIKIWAELKSEEISVPVIKFCVEDNGLGMHPEQLRIINGGLHDAIVDSSQGYGIYNVNLRIKLYYGENYGLTLESKQGEWSKATVIIPAQVLEKDTI